MPMTQHAEVGHRVEVEEPRAGQSEEVAEHAVRKPGLGEIRQAVEDVHGLAAGGLDHRMHLVDEGVEAVLGARGEHLGPAVIPEQRRMRGEAEIDQPPPLRARRPRIGQHECAIVVQRLHLPDDVVAARHAAEHRVQAGQASGGGEGGWRGRNGGLRNGGNHGSYLAQGLRARLCAQGGRELFRSAAFSPHDQPIRPPGAAQSAACLARPVGSAAVRPQSSRPGTVPSRTVPAP